MERIFQWIKFCCQYERYTLSWSILFKLTQGKAMMIFFSIGIQANNANNACSYRWRFYTQSSWWAEIWSESLLRSTSPCMDVHPLYGQTPSALESSNTGALMSLTQFAAGSLWLSAEHSAGESLPFCQGWPSRAVTVPDFLLSVGTNTVATAGIFPIQKVFCRKKKL